MSTPEPNPDRQRIERILDALIERSDREELEWEPGSPPDSYAANVGSLRTRLMSRDGQGGAPYVFELWGQGGNVTLATGTDGSSPALDQRITALYQRAKRIVLDPEKVLTEIEKELGLKASS